MFRVGGLRMLRIEHGGGMSLRGMVPKLELREVGNGRRRRHGTTIILKITSNLNPHSPSCC
jgi:hypothetical protein